MNDGVGKSWRLSVICLKMAGKYSPRVKVQLRIIMLGCDILRILSFNCRFHSYVVLLFSLYPPIFPPLGILTTIV